MSAPSRTIRHSQAEALQGGRAGFISRVAADAVDFLVVEVIYFSILIGIAVVRFLITRKDFSLDAPDLWVTILVQWWIIVLYLGTNWSSTGRSFGKSMLGLRVERPDGGPLTVRRAFLRAAFCATLWASLIWIFVSRRNSALHDILFRTKVVYDWRGPGTSPPVAHQVSS